MARVVDFHLVLEEAHRLNLASAYYNSGSFKYPAGESVEIVGWLGPDDPTIRADLPATLLRFRQPYEKNLSDLLDRVWRARLPGPVWVMPKSHWAFELDHGNGSWMRVALWSLNINPDWLSPRTDGSAIEFLPTEAGFAGFVQTLLTNLVSSDFAILFPGHRHYATIHHHKQIWWQTPNPAFAAVVK